MAATLQEIKEERKGLSLTANWKSTTAVRKFYALYDYIEKGQQQVAWEAIKDYLVAEDSGAYLKKWGNGVPHFPGNTRLPISEISVTQEGQEPKWLITCTYKSEQIDQGFGNQWQGMAGAFPPWWMPWDINTSFSPISWTPVKGGVLAVHRYEDDAHTYLYTVDPRTFMTRSSRLTNNAVVDHNGFGWDEQKMNPILNSAEGLFDNPPEEELFLMTLQLTGARNPDAYPLDGATLQPYLGCVNAEPIVIAGNWFDWGYLRIKNASIANNNWEGRLYQDISIELEANPLSWKTSVVDLGSHYRKPADGFTDKTPVLWGPPMEVRDLNGDIIEWEEKPHVIETDEGEEQTNSEEIQLNGLGSARGFNYTTQKIDEEKKQTQKPTYIDWVTKPFVYYSDLGLPIKADGTF